MGSRVSSSLSTTPTHTCSIWPARYGLRFSPHSCGTSQGGEGAPSPANSAGEKSRPKSRAVLGPEQSDTQLFGLEPPSLERCPPLLHPTG